MRLREKLEALAAEWREEGRYQGGDARIEGHRAGLRGCAARLDAILAALPPPVTLDALPEPDVHSDNVSGWSTASGTIWRSSKTWELADASGPCSISEARALRLLWVRELALRLAEED